MDMIRDEPLTPEMDLLTRIDTRINEEMRALFDVAPTGAFAVSEMLRVPADADMFLKLYTSTIADMALRRVTRLLDGDIDADDFPDKLQSAIGFGVGRTFIAGYYYAQARHEALRQSATFPPLNT